MKYNNSFLCTTQEKWKHMSKDIYVNVHSGIFHNSPELETTQMSVSWWTDKQNMVYPYNGILLSNEKDPSTDTCYDMEESQKCMLNERSQMEKTIAVWLSLYKYPGKANLQRQ